MYLALMLKAIVLKTTTTTPHTLFHTSIYTYQEFIFRHVLCLQEQHKATVRSR